MADLSDVTAYLAQQAASAVYPNGTGQASVANMDCRIFEGWPIADQLDLDLAGKMMSGTPPQPVTRPNGPCANVSIFPMQGTGKAVYQILDHTYTITPAAVTTSVSVNGQVITVSGTLSAGEFLTLVIDGSVVCSQTGATVAAMLAALATQAQSSGYPGASATSTTLTIPFGHSLVVRQGGQAVMGKVTHRQCHSIMVTVWAPNVAVRAALAKAVDGLIKQSNKVTLSDGSQALVIYSRTNTIDEDQTKGIYRRDLIYDVEYATVQQFPGYTITSTQVSIISMVDTSTIAIATE